MITKEEMIQAALERDIDLSHEEYAEKLKTADAVTAAHGIEGKAPIDEEERERRMRMNYYGTVINIAMSILAALDETVNSIKSLNNNLVLMAGGGTTDDGTESDSSN